jgi:hypothetical protein
VEEPITKRRWELYATYEAVFFTVVATVLHRSISVIRMDNCWRIPPIAMLIFEEK